MLNTNTLYITRFVAAMSIVVHHFIPAKYRVGEWGNLFHNFNEGVNYFYFLSGFVMIIAYQKYIFGESARLPKVKYWIKRFARIYPVYLLALLVILSFHFLVQPSFTSVWQRLPFELAMVQQWIGFGSINSPAWSVSCEVFFYVVFPFIILRLTALEGKRLSRAGGWLMAVIIIVTVAGFLADRYNQEHAASFSGLVHGIIYYHPALRITTFIAGCLGGIWFLRNTGWLGERKRYSSYVLVASALAVLAVMFAVPMEQGIWLNYGLLSPLYFTFTVAICNLDGSLQRLLASKSCVFLGDISYGVYILQVPVQMFFAKFVLSTNTLNGFLLYCLVLILVSSVSYLFIEKPLRKEIAGALIPKMTKKQPFRMSPANSQ